MMNKHASKPDSVTIRVASLLHRRIFGPKTKKIVFYGAVLCAGFILSVTIYSYVCPTDFLRLVNRYIAFQIPIAWPMLGLTSILLIYLNFLWFSWTINCKSNDLVRLNIYFLKPWESISRVYIDTRRGTRDINYALYITDNRSDNIRKSLSGQVIPIHLARDMIGLDNTIRGLDYGKLIELLIADALGTYITDNCNNAPTQGNQKQRKDGRINDRRSFRLALELLRRPLISLVTLFSLLTIYRFFCPITPPVFVVMCILAVLWVINFVRSYTKGLGELSKWSADAQQARTGYHIYKYCPELLGAHTVQNNNRKPERGDTANNKLIDANDQAKIKLHQPPAPENVNPWRRFDVMHTPKTIMGVSDRNTPEYDKVLTAFGFALFGAFLTFLRALT